MSKLPVEKSHDINHTRNIEPDRPYLQGRPFRRRLIKNPWIRRSSAIFFGILSGIALGYIMVSLWKYAVAFAPLVSTAFATPADLSARDLNSFVTSERAVALQGVFNNVGPDGAKAPGAAAGYVIASPSSVDPPCKYLNKSRDFLLEQSHQAFQDIQKSRTTNPDKNL